MTSSISIGKIKSDVAVLGGGPGGYVAAIRASQLGGSVVLVEKNKIGGTCTNRGCIPSKSLLRIEEVASMIKQAQRFGLKVGDLKFDFKNIMDRANIIANGLSKNITTLLDKNKVKRIKGKGKLSQSNRIIVEDDKGISSEIEAKNVIIATGSVPLLPQIPGVDGVKVWNSDNIWNLNYLPESVVIIGGGPIGLEFATILQGFGSKVTVLEMMDHIVPNEDQEIADYLNQIIEKMGVKIMINTKVLDIRNTEDSNKEVTASINDERVKVKGEIVILATGRSSNITNLGLEDVDVDVDKGRIVVDNRMQTSVPNIYAVGDVVGKWMLAHVAMQEGEVAAENAMEKDSKIDYKTVPRCIYSKPEVAFVGFSEEECNKRNLRFEKSLYPLSANGRAATMRELNGVIKILHGKEYGEILGAQIISPEASELIHEVCLAISLEATIEDLGGMIFAHPTLSEMVKEGSLRALGRAIHLV